MAENASGSVLSICLPTGVTIENPNTGQDKFADAVASAAQHLQEREAAAEAASEKAKPKSRRGLLLLGLALLAVVIAWDWHALTRPPEPLPVAEQEIDLSWFVLGAVDVVEGYRAEQGRLPTAAELEGVLDPEVTYSPQDESYLLVAESNGATVEYRSELPLEEWISLQGLDSEGGRP